MLLSRFWILVLAIAAGMGIVISVVATRLIDDAERRRATLDLARDRVQLEQVLKIDARARIDAIAPIAANGEIRTVLREANTRQAGADVSEATRTRLTGRLQELNAQLGETAGDILIATDARGIIVGQVGLGATPQGAGLGAFPLVARALAGYVRDDVWLWNDELYRMAARPVVEGGQYAGAIVHGKRIDDAFCARIVNLLSGPSIGFFVRDRLVASAMPDGVSGAPRRDDMAAPLGRVLSGPFASGEVGEPEHLPTGGLAIYAPVVGSASYAQSGYVLARPVPMLASPFAILAEASSEDWTRALPLMGGGTLALFLVGMLLVYFERDRPLRRFRALAEKVGKRELDRFPVQDLGGLYRVSASALNEALDRLSEQAGQAKKKVADLDAILGDAPPPPTASFFGFAGDGNNTAQPAATPPTPAASQPAAAAATNPSLPGAALPATPPSPASTAAARRPPAPAPPAPAPPAPAPPAPRAPTGSPATSPLASTLVGVGSGAATSSGPVQAPRAAPAAPALLDDDDEGQTMVSRVPEELIRQSATGAFAAIGSGDEAHFKETYQQFVATKQQCGEPTAGLTYEKFRETLKKNQEKILQAHGTSKVRFTVYVKDGKAALKATPIK